MDTTIAMVISAIKNDIVIKPFYANFKNPCNICGKSVQVNQKALQCTICDRWSHKKCKDLPVEVFNQIILKTCEPWNCLLCKINSNNDNFPFTLCNGIELTNINDSDSMRSYSLLPNQDKHLLSKFCEIIAEDNNYELPRKSNSNYYSITEMQKLKMSKNFNIFHTNINGLENKFDLLYEFLSNSDSDFDIIGITETSQKSNEIFTSNVSISSYNMYLTSSLSSKGGTSIYVKDNLHNFERNDLKIQHSEFEAVWIEIINKVGKNKICGCIYRHPHQNMNEIIHSPCIHSFTLHSFNTLRIA